MTRSDLEWLVAWSLFSAGKVTMKWIRDYTQLNFGSAVMLKCRKCKKPYFDICVDCTYRNGNALRERGEWNEDTFHGFCRMMARDEMADTLHWMRGYNNPNLRY